MQERGRIDFLGQTLDIELASIFSNWSRWQGSSSSRHLQGFPSKIYRLVLFFHDLNPLYLFFFNLLKIPKYLKNSKILNRGTVRSLDKPLLGFVGQESLSPIHPQRCPKSGWFALDLKNWLFKPQHPDWNFDIFRSDFFRKIITWVRRSRPPHSKTPPTLS